jgi:hypothetical protein
MGHTSSPFGPALMRLTVIRVMRLSFAAGDPMRLDRLLRQEQLVRFGDTKPVLLPLMDEENLAVTGKHRRRVQTPHGGGRARWLTGHGPIGLRHGG